MHHDAYDDDTWPFRGTTRINATWQSQSFSKMNHWQDVYASKDTDKVSWYSPHLDKSLELITKYNGNLPCAVIDVGGGASSLGLDLCQHGFQDISVLDISLHALEAAKSNYGPVGHRIHWIVDDVTKVVLPQNHYCL